MVNIFYSQINCINNLISFSDPNAAGLSFWPKYNKARRGYINLDTTVSEGRHVYGDRVEFWIQTIPSLVNINPMVPIVIGK